jgi:hypothetical protein
MMVIPIITECHQVKNRASSLDLGEGSKGSSPHHLVVEDSKDSRRLAVDNNKVGHHLHHHLRTRRRNQLPYMLLTRERLEAAFTALPMFGLTVAAVSGFIQHMLEETQWLDIAGEDHAGYIMEPI